MKTNSLEGKTIHLPYSQLPTKEDNEAFEVVNKTAPSAETHPNVYACWCLVMKFTPATRAAWGAPAAAAAKGGKGGKAEVKKETKPADDDEFDPFAEGADDEEEQRVRLIKDITITVIKRGQRKEKERRSSCRR